MAFRRRSGRRRFRKSPYDIQTLAICRSALVVPMPSNCQTPFVEAFELVGVGAADINVPPYSKGLTFGGCHFQMEYAINPFFPSNQSFAGVLEGFGIWEALVVLPYLQGFFGTPAYLPLLTNNLVTAGDLADRVLWKRLSTIPFTSIDNIPIASSSDLRLTDDYTAFGPQQVRAKASLDERHGLFYVTAVTSGLTDGGPLTIARNGWFKSAVKQRRR